jgi:hypothetical protein
MTLQRLLRVLIASKSMQSLARTASVRSTVHRLVLGIVLFGAGAFAAQQTAQPERTTLPIGGRAGPVAVGDLNRDGRADILGARVDTGSVSVYLGDGRGTFTLSAGSPFAAGASPEDITLADFNEDGLTDLAAANHETTYATILLGDGKGGFAPASPPRMTVPSRPHPHGVAAGDFDGDRHLDLAIESWQEDAVLIFKGNGKAGFAMEPTRLAVGRTPYWKLRAGDLDGDRRADLVTTNTGGSSVSVSCSSQPISTARVPFAVAIGDLNGDRRPDLAIAHRSGGPDRSLDGVNVLLGKGNCTFDPALPLQAGAAPTAVAVGDIDGDGIGDVAVANMGGNNVTVLLGNRSGLRPAAGSPVAVGKGPSGIAVIDLNGDGKDDIVTGNWESGDVSVVFSR